MRDEPVRLSKLLAEAGVGSRRACDALIEEGRVEIDGLVVRTPGSKVVPGEADIRVDGQRVRPETKLYFLLNKPSGVVCTSAAAERRVRAIDLVPARVRLYTVGRLDEDSEGLLLLTNDGWLAHRLTHPSFEIAKTYRVKARGRVSAQTLAQVRGGVQLAEGKTSPIEVHIKRRGSTVTTMELVLREGMNREIRRVFASLGHNVYHLRRIELGPLRLGKLPRGASRELSRAEVRRLYEAVERKARPNKPKKRKGRRKR